MDLHSEHTPTGPAGESTEEHPRPAPLHCAFAGRAMRKVRDADYPFRGFYGCEAVCHLRVYLPQSGAIDPANPAVAVATELERNTGTSITNMAEHLAQEVRDTFGLGPAALIWIDDFSSYCTS